MQYTDQYHVHPLTEIANLPRDRLWIGFCDPSSLPTNPGWPLRNILALVGHHNSSLLTDLSVLCWRDVTRDGQRNVSHSLILKIKDFVLESSEGGCAPKCLGWEKNDRGKMGPRTVNLCSTMDPERLAESAVDLNLKLMKWRLLPELNLDVTKKTKCLLLGAGTLGCYVARTLMVYILILIKSICVYGTVRLTHFMDHLRVMLRNDQFHRFHMH